MESKLKTQAMDSVGELPAGYLHIPTTPIKQEAAELRAALEQGQKENKQLRKLMCVKTSQSHYMDDGELQDNSEFPVIDFLRDTPEQIESAWKTRMIKKLEAQTPAQPIEPSNKLIFDTVSAREYLIENVITKFKDTTFTNYVRNQLAGDFAYQLAMFIRISKDQGYHEYQDPMDKQGDSK